MRHGCPTPSSVRRHHCCGHHLCGTGTVDVAPFLLLFYETFEADRQYCRILYSVFGRAPMHTYALTVLSFHRLIGPRNTNWHGTRYRKAVWRSCFSCVLWGPVTVQTRSSHCCTYTTCCGGTQNCYNIKKQSHEAWFQRRCLSSDDHHI